MMIKSAYLDTSVFGGYFDEEFSDNTIPFFDRIIKESITVIVSDLLKEEISGAPDFVRELFNKISNKNSHYVTVTKETESLADLYINEKVVSKTSYADCTHIALATITKADILVSWNFKHIVNIDRIREYNAVNLKLGYPILEIQKKFSTMTNENVKTVKGLVQELRAIRDEINAKLEKMTSEERSEYFEQLRTKNNFSKREIS